MPAKFEEIVARLRNQRTDDAEVEVKSSAKKLNADVWDTVSAFANTAGGLIVLGLSEKDGFVPVEGFDIDVVRDQFVEGIGDGGAHGARLTHPPAYGLARETVDNHPVLTITVVPNLPGNRPCFVTAKGLLGGAYKRVDDKNIKLAATEVFQMQHDLTPSQADRQVVEEADESDLDTQVLNDLIARRSHSRVLHGTKNRNEQLVRLNVLDKSGGVRLAGLLATGSYPQQFYPRLIVDVAVHPGNEKSQPGSTLRFLDRVECTGKLADVVDDAVAAVTRNLRTYSVVEEATRSELPEIPVNVIRESIANAVLHREYSALFVGQPVTVDVFGDRVEITNPGGLWGGVTQENLGDGTSRCRNQVLLPLMQHVSPTGKEGFTVEGQGSGIRLMIAEMEAHALEHPKFFISPDQVKVTLARRDSGVSVDILRETLRIDSDEARSVLAELRNEGVLRGVGSERYVLADGAPLLSDTDAEIVRGLAGREPQSIHEIVNWSGLSIGTLRSRLRHLVEDGWVRATAPPQSRNRKYVVEGIREGESS
ncbi:MAG: ATP-binding protein [Gulosibacter sp.]|uniref:ATP-binding protein n=1 Tax=Gulosibacter sp. TaxID=2817531 RepID=UPI003F8E2037